MHEASLIKSLLEQAAAIAARHGGQLAEIAVEVGPLSGVEPELLASEFERLAPARIGTGVCLRIESVALRATCDECGGDFEIFNFHFVCRQCGSRTVQITQGDGLILKHVTVRQPECEGVTP